MRAQQAGGEPSKRHLVEEAVPPVSRPALRDKQQRAKWSEALSNIKPASSKGGSVRHTEGVRRALNASQIVAGDARVVHEYVDKSRREELKKRVGVPRRAPRARTPLHGEIVYISPPIQPAVIHAVRERNKCASNRLQRTYKSR